MLPRFSELCNTGTYFAETFFNLNRYRACICFQALDIGFLAFDIPAQVGVLLFERANLPLFVSKSAHTLRSA